MSTADFMDALRIHPVYGFLFQQRGAMGATPLTSGPGLAAPAGAAVAGGFGEVINPQAMSAAELYRAGFVMPERHGPPRSSVQRLSGNGPGASAAGISPGCEPMALE